jgi:hypothetical protein
MLIKSFLNKGIFIILFKYSRSLYAQFKSGILPLHIETGRYANIRDPHTGNHRKTQTNVSAIFVNLIMLRMKSILY